MFYESIILAAAKAAKISGALLLAICTHESGLKNVIAPHDGGSASFGICQMKLQTAQILGFKGSEKDLMKPETNAKFAALYLKYQLDRYNNEWMKAVAAYNSGTYNESVKVPECPRNLKYIKNIQSKLDHSLKPYLNCGKKKKINICIPKWPYEEVSLKCTMEIL